ncbi:hypothetical protein [Actinoplanes philippinensis]|uniref:hypothetical protein n=1 Tax=Actinoplanes philippinensis TaxID=35752 RepID=UPI0015A5CBCA|nr:hypothetical protein [Actinoplanes philippinensis]
MTDVAEVNSTQPRDWQPTDEQRRRALCNEAYPAAGRVAVPGRRTSGGQLR